MILTTKLPKKDMTNGGMNKHKMIPSEINKIIGSSKEMTRSPGDSSAAANTANIDIISVRKTRKNLFSNVMTPFFIKTVIFF
ncbi:hypothetical protein BCBMB205_05360 [Bacillus sp. CN2]|nr:hypothetical protein BCBMB205_05360 [Bacillus velezensis]ARZ56861.1 hypothetical protein BAGQ_0599 [Bacillus velezensis]GFR56477.1 hypothetical protein BCBMB205_05360 [Bacillus sp. CN2]